VSLPECAKSKRIRLSANTPTRLGLSGPSGPSARAVAYGRSGRIGQVFRPNQTSFQVGQIGQVLNWRKQTSSEIGQVAKTDKFCSDEKRTSSVRLGQTGREEVGRGWAGKRIREVAEPKSRKRISELKIGFLNLPRLGNLHKKI
jgi:hypothetical protein